MDAANSTLTSSGLPAARRADAGSVRLGGRDVAGLMLVGDMYGTPYDLLASFLDVQPARLRGIVARWRHTALLDLIPLLTDTIALHPEHIQAALYQAFDIQALYKDDMNQVTLFATITTSTPQAVAAILTDIGHDPATGTRQPPAPATTAPVYPLAQPPIAHLGYPDHE